MNSTLDLNTFLFTGSWMELDTIRSGLVVFVR